jgi:hypothetical protein
MSISNRLFIFVVRTCSRTLKILTFYRRLRIKKKGTWQWNKIAKNAWHKYSFSSHSIIGDLRHYQFITNHLKLSYFNKRKHKHINTWKNWRLQIIAFQDLNTFHVIGKVQRTIEEPRLYMIWYVSRHTFRNINTRGKVCWVVGIFITTNIWPEAIWQEPNPLYQSLLIACTCMSNHP